CALAYDLNRLGEDLSERGEHAEAVTVFTELLAIRRGALDAAPDDLESAEGMTLPLAELRDALSELGRRDEALAAAREVVSVQSRIVAHRVADMEMLRE